MISTLVFEATYFARYSSGRKITRGCAQRFHDLHRVAAGDADVGLGLHFGRRVDVRDDRRAGIALAQQPHVGAGNRFGERTAGSQIGNEHRLVRVDELRGLGHEMHAAENDDVGIGLGRFHCERQRVSDDIGDRIENFRNLIVVREYDRVAFAL